MDVEVNAVSVTNCSVCQQHDKTAKTAPAPMQPVRYPEGAWKQIGIHFVGPFTSFSGNCRYAITAIDYYSKWPEVGFCSHPTTDAVISFVQGIFSREGYPEVLVSDHDSQFMSLEFKTFLRDRGITHATSSIHYPLANGQVERFSRVLKDYIQSIFWGRATYRLTWWTSWGFTAVHLKQQLICPRQCCYMDDQCARDSTSWDHPIQTLHKMLGRR